MENINKRIFLAINMYAGKNMIADHIAMLIAQYLPLMFILWLLVLWFKNKDTYKDIVLFAGYAGAVGLLFNFIITLFYFHPRPFMMKIGTVLFHYGTDSSFPSDHTTLMLSIALILVYFDDTRKSGVILFFLGLIGGTARVFCGLHFPFDIAGSFIVSLTASFFVFLIRNKLQLINRIILNLYFKIIRK